MDRIKRVFSIIYITGWSLALVLLFWVFWSEGHSNWFYLALTVIVRGALIFYGHLFILYRFFNKKKYARYFLYFLLIFSLGPLLSVLLDWREITDRSYFLDQYFTTLISLFLFCLIPGWVANATENWFTGALKRETLEKQSLRAELAYLRAQINPHFLFNTLNNIHTLAYKNSPVTAEAIMRLSSLMRYMLYESNSDTVSLKSEVDYLTDFINLQQLRFKEKSIVELTVIGEINACKVAPLLFVPLLENAYKHSPPKINTGDIRVTIEVQGNRLTFTIENQVGGTKSRSLDEPGGIGLSNVKKRLHLLYPDQHTCEISNLGDRFKVVIIIPIGKDNEG